MSARPGRPPAIAKMKKISKELQAEIDFIDSIDARFPFENEKAARALASKGAAISDNAALMVGYELATASEGWHAALRLSLLEQLLRERATIALRVAAPVIESLIRGTSFPERAVERLLDYCRLNQGCYNALGILSLCSKEFEEEAEKISEGW
jgi:hypothetical protein